MTPIIQNEKRAKYNSKISVGAFVSIRTNSWDIFLLVFSDPRKGLDDKVPLRWFSPEKRLSSPTFDLSTFQIETLRPCFRRFSATFLVADVFAMPTKRKTLVRTLSRCRCPQRLSPFEVSRSSSAQPVCQARQSLFDLKFQFIKTQNEIIVFNKKYNLN